jgi:CTP-dependent riboflavin kinase
MSLGTFKGQVAGPGFGHFSKCRPKFYQNVLDLSGLSLYPGTINVKIDGDLPGFPMPKTQRVAGQDQIDLDHNQDILITPCSMEGRPGFWILPVFKGTNHPNPVGHLPKGIIEVSLIEKLPNIAPGLKLSLEILGE